MSKRIFTAALLLAALFYPTSGFAERDKAEIEAIIKEYIEKNPDIILQSVRNYEIKMREAQREQEFRQALKKRVDVSIGEAPVKGPDNAKITIFEFSDFQCPYCARSQTALNQVYKEHEGNIKIVFKHLPLSIHAKAKDAARAAMSAGEQGKFWEYKSLLMSTMPEWSRGDEKALFIQYAKQLKLDIPRFEKDQKKESFGKIIESDLAVAKKIGATGTPTFVINGVIVKGAVPLEHFEKVIKEILKDG